MKQTAQRAELTWWDHIVPVSVVAIVLVTLWRPMTAMPALTGEQNAKIDDVAALLGTSFTAGDIEKRLSAFGPFPPESSAGRALADALAMCELGRLGQTERRQLAEELYAITAQGHDAARVAPRALIDAQRTLGNGRCSPVVVDAVVNAGRRVARSDPNPRRDWW